MARRASVILRNSLSTYVRMGIGLFIGLAITRTALHRLADSPHGAQETFGIFMLLTSIGTMSHFLNDSLQKALVRFLAISFHTGDQLQTRRLFTSGWLMNTSIGIPLAALLVLLAPGLVEWFRVPEAFAADAKYAIWILALGHAVTVMAQPWGAALLAADGYTVSNLLALVQQAWVLVGVSSVQMLPVRPLYGLTLVWIIPGACVGVLLAGWMVLHQPLLRPRWRFVHRDDCQQLWALGGWSSVVSVGSNLYERTDQVLINLLLGPAFNAFYAVVIQWETYIGRLVMVLTEVILPTASKIAVSGSRWEQQQLVLRATRYGLTLAVPCVVGTTIFRRQLVELWLGTGFEEAIRILPLAMLLMLCRTPNFLAWPYLTAVNRLKWPALALLIDAIANVGLSILYVTVFDLGLPGIILGTLSTSLMRFAFFQGPYLAKQLELPVGRYWKEGFGRPMVSLLWLIPCLWLVQWLSLSGTTTLALVISTAALYSLWTWIYLFEDYERTLFGNLSSHLTRHARLQPDQRVRVK
jgi:O-antigen/teichoic acid export membrane protein